MVCKNCKKKPVWKFTNQTQLCASCFVKYFNKKVKGTIRKYKMPIQKIKKKSLKANVINKIIMELPNRKGKLIEESLNDISNAILYIMMYDNKDKLRKLLPCNQPLYFLSDKEILLYAKLKRIKGKISNEKAKIGKLKQIDDFLVSLEKKNADIRLNVVNAMLKNYS